jgi:hypothetical protein
MTYHLGADLLAVLGYECPCPTSAELSLLAPGHAGDSLEAVGEGTHVSKRKPHLVRRGRTGAPMPR